MLYSSHFGCKEDRVAYYFRLISHCPWFNTTGKKAGAFRHWQLMALGLAPSQIEHDNTLVHALYQLAFFRKCLKKHFQSSFLDRFQHEHKTTKNPAPSSAEPLCCAHSTSHPRTPTPEILTTSRT